MRTVVIYESRYGNTRRVAQELASVAREYGDVDLVEAEQAGAEVTMGAGLVLIGGPTHVHGMSHRATRQRGATDAASVAGTSGVEERPPGMDAAGPGLREWFHRVDRVHGTRAAAFDTRVDGPEFLTGRASLGISRRLRHHGFTEVAAPRSFLVDTHDELCAGEVDRAREWATSVLQSLPAPAMG